MVIYWDLLAGTTFFVNYGFIKTINLTYKNRISIKRLLVSSLIATMALIFYFVPWRFVWELRHLYGIIIGLIAFQDDKIKNRLIMIISFYLLNYAFVGSLEIFKIKSIGLLVVSFSYIVILYLIEKIIQRSKQTILICKMDDLVLTGLIDTGNHCYYQGLPVSFVAQKYLSDSFVLVGEMLTRSINGEVLVDIYIGPPLIINKQEKNCYYAFIQIADYDLIINQEMGELL